MLGSQNAVLLLLSSSLSALAGNGPLGELDADAVSASLDHDGVLLNSADGAGNTTDGGDLITNSQRIAHVLGFLLTLVLGADHEEVQHGEHQHQHENSAHHLRIQSNSLQKYILLAYANGLLSLYQFSYLLARPFYLHLTVSL